MLLLVQVIELVPRSFKLINIKKALSLMKYFHFIFIFLSHLLCLHSGERIKTLSLLIKELSELKVTNGSSTVLVQVPKKLFDLIRRVPEIHFFTNDTEFFEWDLVIEIPIKVAERISNFLEFLHKPNRKRFYKFRLYLLFIAQFHLALKL